MVVHWLPCTASYNAGKAGQGTWAWGVGEGELGGGGGGGRASEWNGLGRG